MAARVIEVDEVFFFENLDKSHLSPKKSQQQKGQWHERGQW